MIYDCIVIGTGPAGISASITLKIHNKNLLLLGNKKLSEKINKAERILNYPGLPSISGKDLSEAFESHLREMEIQITEKMATSVIPMGDNYAVIAQTDFYETKSVIFATGVTSAPSVKNEEKLLGRGISYCATCDGGLYGRSVRHQRARLYPRRLLGRSGAGGSSRMPDCGERFGGDQPLRLDSARRNDSAGADRDDNGQRNGGLRGRFRSAERRGYGARIRHDRRKALKQELIINHDNHIHLIKPI